jgi:hypothetical protein
MTGICSHCGKEIGKNETYYTGKRDGIEYNLHPACSPKWVPEK